MQFVADQRVRDLKRVQYIFDLVKPFVLT